MSAPLTTDQVWREIERNLFGVLGLVTAKGEARTVGIVYIVRSRKLYIGSLKSAWKVRHVAGNPHCSMTIPIAKRIPFLPWIKIPAATITFAGTARILDADTAGPEIRAALYRGMAEDAVKMETSCVIEMTPIGDFITYGIGMPMIQMRDPEKARGRAAVA